MECEIDDEYVQGDLDAALSALQAVSNWVLLELSTTSVIRNDHTQQASSHQARSTTLDRDAHRAVPSR